MQSQMCIYTASVAMRCSIAYLDVEEQPFHRVGTCEAKFDQCHKDEHAHQNVPYHCSMQDTTVNELTGHDSE